jgi:hypothetical protein
LTSSKHQDPEKETLPDAMADFILNRAWKIKENLRPSVYGVPFGIGQETQATQRGSGGDSNSTDAWWRIGVQRFSAPDIATRHCRFTRESKMILSRSI